MFLAYKRGVLLISGAKLEHTFGALEFSKTVGIDIYLHSVVVGVFFSVIHGHWKRGIGGERG